MFSIRLRDSIWKINSTKATIPFFIKNFNTSSSIKFNSIQPKICIVGSGPAALYTAQYALRNLPQQSNPSIDIFEKLPVPFGLVRFGVAPDHQDVKNVINSFTETLKNKHVNFFGNVNIGIDLRINDLLNAYDCVVLAYGSHSENYLNIKGEKDFKNLISAKDLVSLYNGLPESENIKIDISGKNAVVIGAGNVSIDIARILLSPLEKLEKTDISSRAIELFRNQRKIEHVTILARRGVLNAAFTLKELRELTKIEGVDCKIDLEQFKDIHIDLILNKLARPRKRITEYMFNMAKKSAEQSGNSQNRKIINFIFLKTPIEILGDSSTKYVSGVKVKSNRYNVDFSSPDLKLDSEEALNALKIVEETDKPAETIPGSLIIRSIGYKNINIDAEIPFDKKQGVVPNQKGKVIGKDGLYCTGWIKRGPRGVIVDTTSDAHETAHQICADLKNIETTDKEGTTQIIKLLKERNVKYVDKEGWNRIDEEEKKRGKLVGKPREKFQSIKDMLEIAFRN